MALYVKKSSGQEEPFNIKKFKHSLKKAGASSAIIEQLIKDVLEHPELDTTYKLYEYAFDHLKKVDRPTAARYSLKSALYELGPEGFYFERFVAELFKAQGYITQVGQILTGRCVDHEVDVLIENDHQKMMVECKFHNRRGLKTDVKVTLYIKARFTDLSEHWKSLPSAHAYDGVWLVTNTQFTSQAIKYGLCSGINLLGWAYPEEKGIAQLVDQSGLHPITSLTHLSTSHKRKLLAQGVLLCKELIDSPDHLKKIDLPLLEGQKIIEECTLLCKTE